MFRQPNCLSATGYSMLGGSVNSTFGVGRAMRETMNCQVTRLNDRMGGEIVRALKAGPFAMTRVGSESILVQSSPDPLNEIDRGWKAGYNPR